MRYAPSDGAAPATGRGDRNSDGLDMKREPMRQVRNLTLIAVASVVAAMSPRIAAAQSAMAGFKTPSGNVYCLLETPENDNGLRCDVRQVTGRLPPKPASCQFAWGKSFEIIPKGSVGTRICVSDTVYDPSLPILAYGARWTEGGFVCKSAEAGLTCTNAAGHGFMLSRETQSLF
jgi:hypothetical protein